MLSKAGGGNSYGSTPNFKRQSQYDPNWTYGQNNAIDPSLLAELMAGSQNNGGVKGMFDKLVNNYKARYDARRAPGGMFNAGSKAGNYNIPSSSTAVVPMGPNVANSTVKPIGWNKGTGLSVMGKNVGKAVPYIAGGISAVQALGGLNDLSESRANTEDLVSQILVSASGNPYATFDLTSDQKSLLRQLKRDGDSADASISDIDLIELLKGAGTGALMGLPGGVAGALTGAIGGAVNAGVDSVNSEQVANQAELEALLQALTNSEMNYNNMVRQRAYANF